MAAAGTAVLEKERTDRSIEKRITDAAARLVSRWGVRKTTLADIAQEAGCARASVYRAFPGGKQELLLAVGAAELDRFLAAVAAEVDAQTDAIGALTAALWSAANQLADHQPLQFLLRYEPDLVLPYLSFPEMSRIITTAATVVGPHLEPFVGDGATKAAEWLGRLTLSFLFNPGGGLDPRREADARHLVANFVLPALEH